MRKTRVCLRIDIDTIRDTEVLPIVLGILNDYDIHATFFVTTGTDATFKNCIHYTNPFELLRKKAFMQHGFKQMFRGLFSREHVQKSGNIHMILDEKHELGLHGYHHFNWMNSLQKKEKDEIIEWIKNGCTLFEEEFGYKPKAFSSPGFSTSPQFIGALDSFGFDYSSDFRGTKAFYPETDGRRSTTLQLPVAEKSLGELEFDGLSEKEILNRMKNGLDNAQDYFIFYMHPSYEPVLKTRLLKGILDHITSDRRFEIITMARLAKEIKRRESAANPADI